jgi:ATP-dependent DNA helicase RecG
VYMGLLDTLYIINYFTYHRDYAEVAGSIMVAIYDDHLEIWNPGELPKAITLSDLKERHRSYPRNRLIAGILYIRGMIEAWGTGTNKIVDICAEEGLPEPTFEQYTGGLSITFKFKEPMGVITKAEIVLALNPLQKEILELLKRSQQMNIDNIQSQLSEANAKRTVQNYLSILKRAGLVELKGHGKKSFWVMK